MSQNILSQSDVPDPSSVDMLHSRRKSIPEADGHGKVPEQDVFASSLFNVDGQGLTTKIMYQRTGALVSCCLLLI